MKSIGRILNCILFAACILLLVLSAPAKITGRADTIPSSRRVIFVGDSRTVGMYMSVNGGAVDRVFRTDDDGDLWVARTGAGIDWLRFVGVPGMEPKIDANTDIVFFTGINDEGYSDFASQYATYLNKEAAVWAGLGARTYFISVMPVRRNYAGISNDLIRQHNEELIENFSQDITYIDLATPFEGHLLFADDVHYLPDTYSTAYEYIKLLLAADAAQHE